MVAVSSGLTGPTCSRIVSPSRITVWAAFVWLEMVIRIGPAPTLAGETVTFLSWITPVNSLGMAGRGRFLKSSLPQAASAPTDPAKRNMAAQRVAREFRVALIPPNSTLTQPDRFSRGEQGTQLPLDAAADVLGEPLHQRHVGEDRHGLLRAHHRHRHDGDAGAHRRAHEAAAPEAPQPVALPVELARALLPFGEHERQPLLVAQEPLGVGRGRGWSCSWRIACMIMGASGGSAPE